MAYFVSWSETTCAEPSPGWYAIREDEDGNEEMAGPFCFREDALDWESDGAYSQYLEMKMDEERERRAFGDGFAEVYDD